MSWMKGRVEYVGTRDRDEAGMGTEGELVEVAR